MSGISKIDATSLNQKTLDLVNRMLPAATTMGAYAMGMVCVAVWQVDPSLEIPYSALHGAMGCTRIEEANRYAVEGQRWAAEQKAKLAANRNDPKAGKPA